MGGLEVGAASWQPLPPFLCSEEAPLALASASYELMFDFSGDVFLVLHGGSPFRSLVTTNFRYSRSISEQNRSFCF